MSGRSRNYARAWYEFFSAVEERFLSGLIIPPRRFESGLRYLPARAAVASLLCASIAAAQPVWRHADGGVAIIDVERAALLVPGAGPEAPRVLHVDGGTWVAAQQRIQEGQEHADLVARNRHLEDHAADMPKVWVGGAFAVGAALGVVAGVVGVLAAQGKLTIPPR